MGAMYAAHLVAADVPVTLVAAGDRARRLRDPGITVNGVRLQAGVLDLDDPAAVAAARATPTDLVLVAVKSAELPAAIDAATVVVGPDTTILSILNGLDSEPALAERFGEEAVLLSMSLGMDARRDGASVVHRQVGRIVLGEAVPGRQTQRLTAVQAVLDRAGLAWETPADIRHAMWWKFMVNVGVNQASAVLRAGYGAFVAAGPARELMLALMREVIAVAAAEGVELGPDDLRRWDDVLAGQPADGWTSMLQDVMAGRPTEAAIFAGRVVALGREHGIPTPHNETVGWILQALPATPDGGSARP